MATMSEILSRFKKDIKNSFQAQKNIVDVTEKYIGLLENAEGGGAGGVDYSTTEQLTGRKSLDGKDIYCKTFANVDIPVNAETTTVQIGASIDTIYDFRIVGYLQEYSSSYYTAYNVYAKFNSAKSSFNPISTVSAYTGANIYMEYTKA